MPTLLVDGDQYIHKTCAAGEHDTRWDEDNHVLWANEEEVWDTLQASIGDLQERFGASSDIVVCLGQAPYFRHDLFPAYKPGRGRKPLAFADIRRRVQETYKCVEFAGLEADDVMGILATRPGNDAIIVARDKDMNGVGPAKVWDGSKFMNISEAEADYFHLYQTLTGDTTDGYKGCPGVGPVKATSLLTSPRAPGDTKEKGEHWEEEGLLWPRVVHAFKKAGLTEDDALLQARLARILRWSDWDSKNKVPILWTPN